MKNALTVDLEDYFHVSAYSGKVRLEEWDSYPSRVAENTDRLLDLLAEKNCLATFFVLGWVAEKKPEIVGRVAAAGHEIACHSLLHRKIFDLTPQEFREDTHRAKAVIEDATANKVFNTIPACSRCGTPLMGFPMHPGLRIGSIRPADGYWSSPCQPWRLDR